jgi:hypothetical protein
MGNSVGPRAFVERRRGEVALVLGALALLGERERLSVGGQTTARDDAQQRQGNSARACSCGGSSRERGDPTRRPRLVRSRREPGASGDARLSRSMAASARVRVHRCSGSSNREAGGTSTAVRRSAAFVDGVPLRRGDRHGPSVSASSSSARRPPGRPLARRCASCARPSSIAGTAQGRRHRDARRVAPRRRDRSAPAHGPLAAGRVQGAARRHAAEDRRRCRS